MGIKFSTHRARRIQGDNLVVHQYNFVSRNKTLKINVNKFTTPYNNKINILIIKLN